MKNYDVYEVIRNGFVFVIEECCLMGIYFNFDIIFNLLVVNVDEYKMFYGLFSDKKMKSDM